MAKENDKLMKRIERCFSRGVVDYGLIADDDRILVGLSGGKDSLALLELLAKRAKAPVVVMTTKGTNKIAKRMVLRSTKVELDVIEVIDKETVQNMKLSDLSAHVRESIANALQQK